MKKYPCPVTKTKDVYPRCTTIISDSTNSSAPLTQWAANMVVEYIKEHCQGCITTEEGNLHTISDEDLNSARFNFREVSQTALDIGSEVHGLIEDYLTYTLKHEDGWIWPDGMSKEVENAFRAFWDWSIDNDLKPIEIEKTVYGQNWAGTCDYIGMFNDKKYIIDWKSSKPKNKKTGKGIYPESRYQVAAYRSAEDERIKSECYNQANREHMNPINRLKKFKKLVKFNETEGCGVLRLDKETGMPDWNDTSDTFNEDLKVFNSMVQLYFDRHKNIRNKFNKHIKEVGI